MNILAMLRGKQTQEAIARRLGIERGMLSRFETGACNPNIEQARLLCELYERGIYEIYEKSDLDYKRLQRPKERRKGPDGVPLLKLTVRLSAACAQSMRGICAHLRLTQAQYIERCVDRDMWALKLKNRPAERDTPQGGNEKYIKTIIQESGEFVNEHL